MPRIRVTVDSDLLSEIVTITGEVSNSAAVEAGLRTVVRIKHSGELIQALKDGMLPDLGDPDVTRSAQR